MVELKVGDKFPDNVTFTYVHHALPQDPNSKHLTNRVDHYSYVPFTEAEAGITVCGFPQPYNASKEWADKKVVIFALPGAFTIPHSDTISIHQKRVIKEDWDSTSQA